MMRILTANRREMVGLIVFVAASLTALALVANTLRQSGAGRVEYEALFVDASGVQSGDEVRVAGVAVGRVESAELDNGKARVRFTVDADQKLRTDTRARVSYLNLLGKRYIALEPGDKPGKPLQPGAVIGPEKTSSALSLTAMFNAFKPLFDALDPADVNQLAQEVVTVLQGEGTTIANLSLRTANLTEHLAGRDEVITRVIDNVNAVMESTASKRPELGRVVIALEDVVGGLADDIDQVEAAIVSMDRLTLTVSDLVTEADQPTIDSLRSMRAIGSTMTANLQSLQRASRDTSVMLDAYARSMSYGSWLNIYICSLSLDIPGVGTVRPSSGQTRSEVCR